MELVDAHCHFDFPAFDSRRETLLEEAGSLGIRALVIPGVRRPDWSRVADVAAGSDRLWYCLGIHPWFVGEHGEEDLDHLRARLETRPPGCVALGECGLDRLKGDMAQQQPWFEAQLDIARTLVLPLVVHSVRSHDEVAALFRRKPPTAPVLIHGFSGSYQQARALVDLGCLIGVGGVITHGRARKSRDAIARLPADALVLETDAPDMPPAGVTQGHNTPLQLVTVFEALRELRQASGETLAAQLLDNVCRLYGWSLPERGQNS